MFCVTSTTHVRSPNYLYPAIQLLTFHALLRKNDHLYLSPLTLDRGGEYHVKDGATLE